MLKTVPPNKHQQKRHQTKEKLKQTTFELIKQQSYDDINVQDIVKASNIARGTFYIHFNNKEEISWALLEDKLKPLAQKLNTYDLTQHQQRQQKWLYIFTYIHQEQDTFKILLGKKGHLSLIRRTTSYIKDIIIKDMPTMFPNHPQPSTYTATFIAGALLNCIIDWLESPEQYSIHELAELFYTSALKIVNP